MVILNGYVKLPKGKTSALVRYSNSTVTLAANQLSELGHHCVDVTFCHEWGHVIIADD